MAVVDVSGDVSPIGVSQGRLVERIISVRVSFDSIYMAYRIRMYLAHSKSIRTSCVKSLAFDRSTCAQDENRTLIPTVAQERSAARLCSFIYASECETGTEDTSDTRKTSRGRSCIVLLPRMIHVLPGKPNLLQPMSVRECPLPPLRMDRCTKWWERSWRT